MSVVPGKILAIEGNDLGQRTRTAELSRHHQGGQPQQLHDSTTISFRIGLPPLQRTHTRVGSEASDARPSWPASSADPIEGIRAAHARRNTLVVLLVVRHIGLRDHLTVRGAWHDCR
jgi:hypothetical protein